MFESPGRRHALQAVRGDGTSKPSDGDTRARAAGIKEPCAGMTLRELRSAELGEAAHLLGSAMCDNPANVRVFRIPDRERRTRALERFFVPVLGGLHQRGLIYGAFRGGSLVGVCGMARPAFCRPTVLEAVGIVPSAVLGNPAGTILRVMTWVGEWARRDLAEPHWHLGPVAVDPQLQGQGVGTAMLTAFCSHMDDLSMLSYLETDKYENVRFYRRLGFAVVAEAEVLGVPNWFMSRPGGAAASVVENRGHGVRAIAPGS
jgi:ribosomal protein S18 acetylase RimI-like enzyme